MPRDYCTTIYLVCSDKTISATILNGSLLCILNKFINVISLIVSGCKAQLICQTLGRSPKRKQHYLEF